MSVEYSKKYIFQGSPQNTQMFLELSKLSGNPDIDIDIELVPARGGAPDDGGTDGSRTLPAVGHLPELRTSRLPLHPARFVP
jgi:hypothetical protein